MKSSDRHPSRAQLIAAATSEPGRLGKHLQECAECREFFALVRRFPLAGSVDFVAPSEDAISRWINTPLLAPPEGVRAKVAGRVVFDSWRERPAAVRDIPEGLVRRLRLAALNLALEIVGERRHHAWQFVARVYRDRRVVTDFALKAGRQRLLAGEDGFFTWSSARPPRTVELLSPNEQVHFESVSW